MRFDHSLKLSIFHMNRWMTWRQVKKMNSSSLNILAWSTSHYFFKHCNHDFQYLRWLFYLISFHQLLDDIVNVMKTFWYRRSRRVVNSSITCNHNLQTLHLSCFFHKSYLFISYWHWYVINLLRRLIVTVRRSVVVWVKTLHDNFFDHAMF